MNKKGLSILVPLFTITVLLFIVFMALHITNMQPGPDFVPIGERQEAIINLHFERNAIHTYGRQAARIAIQQAIDIDPFAFEEQTQQQFRLLMNQYPSAIITANYDVTRQADQVRIHSRQDITLTTRASRVAPPITTTPPRHLSGGVFGVWPVVRDENNPAVFTSLFGYRTPPSATASTAHAGLDIRAAENTPAFSMDAGEVIHTGGTGGNKYAHIQHSGGWMCGYYHIEPTVARGDTVQPGEQIGVISPHYPAPHLDVRCMNTEQAWTQAYLQSIGANYAHSRQTPTNTPLHFISTDFGYWADPFCLFAPELQEEMVAQEIARAPSLRSGLFYRTGNHDPSSFTPEDIRDALYMLCPFYAERGIIDGTRTGDVAADAFIDVMIAYTIDELEGTEFTNRPGDPPTRFGITLPTLRAYTGDDTLTAQDVENMPRELAEQIYYEEYYRGWGFDLLPADTLPIVFDTGVLQGPPRAANLLRSTLSDLGYPQEGNLNRRVTEETADQVMQAIQDHGTEEVVSRYATARIQFLRGLNNWEPNRCGWTRRVESFRPESHAAEAHREPGCQERTLFSVFRDGSVAGQSWQSISARLQQTGAELSYRFPLNITAQLTQEQAQYLNQVTDLRDRLRSCNPLQATCIDQSLQASPLGFAYCQDYERELQDAIQRCQEAFATARQCACALPLPQQGITAASFGGVNITITEQGVRRDVPVYWTTSSGEEGVDVRFFVANNTAETPTHSASTAFFTNDRVRILIGQQFPALDPLAPTSIESSGFDRYIWATSTPDQDGHIIALSPHSTLPSCDQRVERTFCRQHEGRDQEFSVDIRIQPTPPPAPTPSIPGTGSSPFFPDPLQALGLP